MNKMLLLLSLASGILFAGNGAELTKANCASCHMLTSPTPDMIPTLKAPAMDAVMFHIKLDKKKKKDIKDFIVDYTQNPAAEKSVCESNKVQKFGVMPSLKDKVSPKNLATIADYMIDNYPAQKFVTMIKEIQRNDKMNALINSPFLINQSALPHMTKILLQNWDKATLGLNAEEALVDGEDPKSVHTKVDEVAKLKAEATKVHLKCISDTMGILSDEQMEFLFPFWDM